MKLINKIALSITNSINFCLVVKISIHNKKYQYLVKIFTQNALYSFGCNLKVKYG